MTAADLDGGRPRSRFRPVVSRRLLAFTAGSGLGLLVDLGGFQAAVHLGVAPGAANVLSSLTSIVVVYFAVTRRAFSARPGPWTFTVFVGWYAANVGATSLVIAALVDGFDAVPLLAKAACVPVSFAANYGFNLVLHRVAARVSAHRAAVRDQSSARRKAASAAR